MTARYVARRLAQALPTVGGLLVVTFLLIRLAPGDPVLALAGEHGDPAHYAFIREKFGLDRALPEQFGLYVASILRGDLGVSYVHGRPVAAVLVERLPATALLMTTALALSTGAGVGLGTLAARRSRGATDLTVQIAALLGHATPAFWLGQVALVTLAAGAGLFPIQGMTDARHEWTGLRRALDILQHLALPALVLAAGELALTTRLVRTGVLEALSADYVRTARAKGLAEPSVTRHALGNALVPVVTVIGARVAALFSGAVLVEIVFSWPGLGRLLLASLQSRDYPMLLGLFLLVATAVVLANLLTDLVCGWLDPRIRS